VCSSLYYEGDSERLLRVSEALALVEAGTIGPATLIYSEQPAFDFDEWTPWAGCSFCFGVGERDAALASAAHEDEDGAARTCSSLYYSIDGASSSEELSVAAAHELVSAGAIVGDTLVYSEQAGFGYDGWTKWSACSHCFPGPSSASHVAPRAVVCYGWLEKKGGDTHIDEHNVLQKERHYLKGGRRNWKRRWFVLHSDGELSYYSQGPKAPAAADGDAAAGGGKPKHSGDVIPHFMHWKGRLQLVARGGGEGEGGGGGGGGPGLGPTWHVRDDSEEEFLLELPKQQPTQQAASSTVEGAGDGAGGGGGGGGGSSRNAMLLRAADAAERQVWISAVVETFNAPIAPLLHDGEERGVAERTLSTLRSALAVAGGGLRGEAARMPADQAIALFDFVAEQPGDLGFKKGQKLQLERCKGEWWTGSLLLALLASSSSSSAGGAGSGSAGVGTGTFPAAFVARGKVVPAKPPPWGCCFARRPSSSSRSIKFRGGKSLRRDDVVSRRGFGFGILIRASVTLRGNVLTQSRSHPTRTEMCTSTRQNLPGLMPNVQPNSCGIKSSPFAGTCGTY